MLWGQGMEKTIIPGAHIAWGRHVIVNSSHPGHLAVLGGL